MSMRATPFCSTQAGFKQEKNDTFGFDKTHVGTATVSPVSRKRESCDLVTHVEDFQGARSRPRDIDQTCMNSKVAFAATVAEALPGDNNAVGVLSPGRPMGGEGTPVKGKPLAVDRMDQMVLNNNTKDGEESAKGVVPGIMGSASIELSSEGKWKNIRKTPSNPHTQANCLRQILLLQLDLIEQQQQQLQAKDKEIEELKTEKDTLRARIERMERRLQLTKKDPPRDKRLFQPLEPWTPDKEDMWDLEGDDPQQTTPTSQHSLSRGSKVNKRKACFTDPKVQKLSRSKGVKLSPQKLDVHLGSPPSRELRSKDTPENTDPQIKAEPDLGCQIDDLPFMSTTEMYLCCWNQPPLSPLRETSPQKEEEVASESTFHKDTKVPSWRENYIEPMEEESPCDLLEMLDDSTFLKRHAKLELNEKRRKRWDIQRIREQRMFQRLQQRMNRKKIVQESEPELSSFYPDTEDVEAIVVTPFLPVVAFGRPLPKLTQQNFELPWLDERSRCRIEVPKKQTPHRTCRK
ncbi:male-specific lethal 1 homolog [Neosynchiropus ocellatus]